MSRKISEDIFTLIKSLSKPEKRYFRFHASMGNDKKNIIYLRLFNAIDIQKKYSEKKLLKKIPELNPLHLSSLKNYLGELILEKLQWYHSHGNINARLWSFISKIEVLYNKGLYKHCNIQIEKAKELAKQYEKFNQLTEILKWEGKIINTTMLGSQKKLSIENVFTENVLTTEKIRNEVEYELINNKLFSLYSMEGSRPTRKLLHEVNKIIRNPLFRNKENLSHNEYYYYCSIHSICYYILTDWEKSYLFQKKIIEHFEQHPHHIDDTPSTYISTLNNFIISCGKAKKEKEIENKFQQVNQMMGDPAYSINNRMILLLGCSFSVLTYYITAGEFQKSALLIPSIEKKLNSYIDAIDKMKQTGFFYTLSYSYFGASDYKRSLFWLNKILNDSDTNARNDIQVFARLLNLIVHFELGNIRELEYLIKSAYRFLLNKNRLYKTETLLLDFFQKKILKINSKKELLIAFKELKLELEKLYNKPTEREAFSYFDFISWLESKLTGESFANMVKVRWNKT